MTLEMTIFPKVSCTFQGPNEKRNKLVKFTSCVDSFGYQTVTHCFHSEKS